MKFLRNFRIRKSIELSKQIMKLIKLGMSIIVLLSFVRFCSTRPISI